MDVLTNQILAETIRKRPEKSYKGTFGRVCLIGGNHQFGGAIIMATEASVYSGAGLNTTLTDPLNFTSLHARLPEAMVEDFKDLKALAQLVSSANTVVVGPGLGTDTRSQTILEAVFQSIRPDQVLLIDGSAISLIAKQGLALPDAHLIFTPHEMEWQRLSGLSIERQENEANQRVRDELNGIVVLKAHRTRIYTATKSFINKKGTPAQATGGMGDTLAGIIGGFTAQFNQLESAVLAAVYTHSDIASQLAQSQYVVLPTQITNQLPSYMHAHQGE